MPSVAAGIIETAVFKRELFTAFWRALLLIKKLIKKPCVIWGQGSDVYVQWRFREPISKIVFKKADAIIALTDDMKNEMKNIYDRDIDVLPNAIDLNKVKYLLKQDVQDKLGIKKDKKIILFAGALTPIKGLTYLIEAMLYIGDKNKQLILLGDGEEREKLEDLVKKLKLENHVTFIGKVTYNEVFKYMVASDIFVLSSLSEGLPNVILEALLMEVPVIATNVGGTSEIIDDYISGVLITPGDHEIIANKIMQYMDKITREGGLNARFKWDGDEVVIGYDDNA